MAEYKVGDRMKITKVYEGQVVEVGDGYLELDNHVAFYLPDKSITVEVLEPQYEDGAMYLSAGGFFYHRTQGKWRSARNGDFVADYYPTRPLRKLVPEGE